MKKQVDTSKFVYQDLFGTTINVDDYITYAAVDGRSGTLRVGQVLELTHSKQSYGEPKPKVRVKSWSNFRAGLRQIIGDADDTKSGRQKDVSLEFLDRLIVIPEEMISEKIWLDLNGPAYNWDGTEIKPKK